MTDQTPVPSNLGADHRTKDRRTGRLLVGAGAFNLVLAAIVAGLLLILAQVTSVNSSLADALSQQREQFTNCKDKPATASGCTTPVAAEPSVIVSQGGRGLPGLPGATGAAGLRGPQGPEGPVGPTGPAGPPGSAGKTGPPPGCALLSTACVGVQGERGPKGDAGEKGEKGDKGDAGEAGQKGDTGTQGTQGEMGVQGPVGVSVGSTQCITDDTATGSHWLITYKDGTQETSPGPCRLAVP